MYGEPVKGDAFQHACLKAIQGCDAGMVAYHLTSDHLDAALVFAPEVALQDAAVMLPICAIGFQNALGALAPPEVAVHLEWAGNIRVNGARCGRMSLAASNDTTDKVPEWLVVGLHVPLWPDENVIPGEQPDETTLYAEGCVDVGADKLLEAWARHTLNWIGRWEDEGTKPVHSEWRGLAHGVGEELEHGGKSGTFVGIDERFGMLFRTGDDTTLIPLTTLLDKT